MEVNVLRCTGLPDEALLSMRSCGIRRQAVAAVAAAGAKSFKFPRLDPQEPIKVDVMQKVGSAYLVLKPPEGRAREYKLVFGDGADMSCDLEVKTCDLRAAAAADGAQPATVDECAETGKSKADPQSAKEYLEQCGVVPFFQALIHLLIKERPKDAFAFLAERMATEHGKPRETASAGTGMPVPLAASPPVSATAAAAAAPEGPESPAAPELMPRPPTEPPPVEFSPLKKRSAGDSAAAAAPAAPPVPTAAATAAPSAGAPEPPPAAGGAGLAVTQGTEEEQRSNDLRQQIAATFAAAVQSGQLESTVDLLAGPLQAAEEDAAALRAARETFTDSLVSGRLDQLIQGPEAAGAEATGVAADFVAADFAESLFKAV